MAYPVGGDGNPRYVVMETHYDNPTQRSGQIYTASQIKVIAFVKKQIFSMHAM